MLLYKKHLTLEEALPEIEKLASEIKEVQPFYDFIKSNGRGIIR